MQNEQSLKYASGERLPMSARMLFAALSRIRHGRLELMLPGGIKRQFGQAEDAVCMQPMARWIIRDLDTLSRIIRRGDLGFAEGYLEGEWDTPNLLDLLMLLDANSRELEGVGAGKWLSRVADIFFHWTRRNSRAQSRNNIEYHYDLGNAFYRLWLDETMTYSSAIFTSADDTLEEAQHEKYRRLREPLNLTADSHLLEIGSGWGGFAIEAVKATGCRVTSITLSREQLEEARIRAMQAGVADRIEFRLQDYRDLNGDLNGDLTSDVDGEVHEKFDAIASCEMFEAVGEEFWQTYFHTLRDCLKPGGKVSMQVITINDDDFAKYRKGVDFIQRYIFPGGMLPSPEVFERVAGKCGLQQQQREFYGQDYAETLARWDRRVLAARERIAALGFDDRFLRMWRYYLKYCETGFRNGRIDVMQVVLEHGK